MSLLLYFESVGPTNYILSVGAGTYNVSGQSVNTLYNRVLSAGIGSYSVSGQNIFTLYNRRILSDVGVYTIDGQVVNLLYSGDTPTNRRSTGMLSMKSIRRAMHRKR